MKKYRVETVAWPGYFTSSIMRDLAGRNLLRYGFYNTANTLASCIAGYRQLVLHEKRQENLEILIHFNKRLRIF